MATHSTKIINFDQQIKTPQTDPKDKNWGHEVAKVSGQVVKEAAFSMKPGKGDVSCGFSSDGILNAPDILFDHLAASFCSFLFHVT